jgi:hypothetical protein
MGGWPEEVFYALYQQGMLCLQEKRSAEGVVALLDAYACRPSRREPLVALARHYRLQSQYPLAYLFAKRAVAIPRPDDILFLDESAYTYRADDELSIAAYWVGEYAESLAFADRVLSAPELPASDRPRIQKNRQFAVDTLAVARVEKQAQGRGKSTRRRRPRTR